MNFAGEHSAQYTVDWSYEKGKEEGGERVARRRRRRHLVHLQ